VNWKNVLLLIGADIKSHRIVSGERFRRFRESKVITYALYVGACLLGAFVGWVVGRFYGGIGDSQMKGLALQGAISFFISFPTIALLYGLMFTQMSQVQRIGVKVSVQPLYWFPITWQEHTLASVLANIIGIPLAVTLSITFGIAVASMFLGLVSMALFTTFALFVNIFMASATTEITRILQMRVSGAITKTAGRSAVWLRIIGSMLFFIIFYMVYFSLYYQTTPLVLLEMVASGQKLMWFIPYVWPGIALSYLASGLTLETVIFSAGSVAFMYFLFLVATKLNIRYGLYEMPAIRISEGVYVPKAGLLGRLGFSPLEAAMMRKDFKAFTRRQELGYIFILPVVSAIMPILSAMRTAPAEAPIPHWFYSFLSAYLTLVPGTMMAAMLGTMMIGLEGSSVWHVYSSPTDARSLVRAKYYFTTLFSLAVTLTCSAISVVVWTPSARLIIPSVVEAVFLIFSLSMISLSFGIRGADFRELPRGMRIRPKWGLVNGLLCIVLAAAIFSPIIPYAVNFLFEAIQSPTKIVLPVPEAYIYVALPVSGVIASAVTYAFHRIAMKNAENLLISAEEL